MITANMVKELREATGAGMLDCKKALTETNGNMEEAITWLREKGISKAAKKLHMAQPPLSMQLKQLEEELSVILLKRGNKQIELTEAGNRFYKRCLQILDLTEITKNELKQSYQDVLRIGITSCLLYTSPSPRDS